MDYVIFDLIGNQRFTNHNSKYGAKRMNWDKIKEGINARRHNKGAIRKMIGQFVPTYSEENAQFVPMSYVFFDGTIVSKQMGVMDSDLNSQVGPQGDIEQALGYMVFKTTGQVGSMVLWNPYWPLLTAN